MMRFLRKRNWVVFYLEPKHRVCNGMCWLKLYEGEFDGTGSSLPENKCQKNFIPDDIDPEHEAMMADSPDRFRK